MKIHSNILTFQYQLLYEIAEQNKIALLQVLQKYSHLSYRINVDICYNRCVFNFKEHP